MFAFFVYGVWNIGLSSVLFTDPEHYLMFHYSDKLAHIRTKEVQQWIAGPIWYYPESANLIEQCNNLLKA